MKKHAIGTVLVALLACAAVALPFQSDWKEYSYADDGFAITAPAKPVFVAQTQATPIGNLEAHNYAVDLGDNRGVMVSVTDFKQGDSLPAKPLLEGAKSGTAATLNGKLSNERDISLAGYPGIQFDMETATHHMQARYYIVKGKLVAMVALAPISAPIPAEAGRVLDSLRLF